MKNAPDLITRLYDITRNFDGVRDPSERQVDTRAVAETARDAVSEILRLRHVEAKVRPPLPSLDLAFPQEGQRVGSRIKPLQPASVRQRALPPPAGAGRRGPATSPSKGLRPPAPRGERDRGTRARTEAPERRSYLEMLMRLCFRRR